MILNPVLSKMHHLCSLQNKAKGRSQDTGNQRHSMTITVKRKKWDDCWCFSICNGPFLGHQEKLIYCLLMEHIALSLESHRDGLLFQHGLYLAFTEWFAFHDLVRFPLWS